MVNSEGETETVVVEAVGGKADDAREYVHEVAVPATTTKNADLTLRRDRIVAPLIYVATHVIQAELVGFLGLDRVGLVAAIIMVPRYFVCIVASAILISSAILASSCCILPLGFGRKSKLLSRQLVQLLDKLLAIIP